MAKTYATISALILTLLASTHVSAAPIRIGGFDGSRVFRPFDDANYSQIRSRLLDPANFGPAGTVGRSVEFKADTALITDAYLSDLNIFIMTEVFTQPDALAPLEVSALTDFVLEGGCLIMISDTLHSPNNSAYHGGFDGSNAANQVLAVLDPGASVATTDDDGAPGDQNDGQQGLSGVESATAGQIVAAPGSGVLSGPFGTLAGGDFFGASWHNELTTGVNSHLLGTRDGESDDLGILMEIPMGAIQPGAGSVLVAGDLLFFDGFIPPGGVPGYQNENNAILFQNFVAQHAIPEPASAILLTLGIVSVAAIRRRRAKS